jgi:hypothetical protein
MRPQSLVVISFCLLVSLKVSGQKKLENNIANSNFAWVIDSLSDHVILFYEKNSYAEIHRAVLRERIQYHLVSTLSFIGMNAMEEPIHYFVLEDRAKMKLLVGYETNGNANPENNFITGIFSSGIKSVYSNHELFHLIAMKLWGYPEIWINEGMAVYSDNRWSGYDLHELSKYLLDTGKLIPLNNLTKNIRKYDAAVAYPLLGSFMKFLDETYGRDAVRMIWEKGRKQMKKYTGKELEELETEWLQMLQSVGSKELNYLVE